MKNAFNLLIFLTASFSCFSQSVVKQRVSALMPEIYPISGEAFLEELDNGDKQLRLSSEFDTPFGSDVRIFLNNSVSISGGVQIANLRAINHFEGAITFEVPQDVEI